MRVALLATLLTGLKPIEEAFSKIKGFLRNTARPRSYHLSLRTLGPSNSHILFGGSTYKVVAPP